MICTNILFGCLASTFKILPHRLCLKVLMSDCVHLSALSTVLLMLLYKHILQERKSLPNYSTSLFYLFISVLFSGQNWHTQKFQCSTYQPNWSVNGPECHLVLCLVTLVWVRASVPPVARPLPAYPPARPLSMFCPL